MKTAFLIGTLLLSVTANAAGVKYICKETTEYQKQTLILTQVTDREIKEGVKERFVLEVYQGYEKEPRLVTKGYVSTEDVMFSFKSDDKLVSAMIYLDELDQASLSEGRKDTGFDCN
ncbi:MAG: hypothetical protein A2X86_06990 [Bdellovibrionales bacterium GWA2_49_15]|nr:MAG: hypothetical protein A2X86_06990 [Bdellovibrionales bacterium GWA2_49_15]HAZ11979.1 hypothetical protein [Bdellovibrionales bacterium]